MWNRLLPYAKPLAVAALLAVAWLASLAGVDVGLDTEHYVAVLVADLVVLLTPAPGYRAPSETPDRKV